jgi:hypothetical protein
MCRSKQSSHEVVVHVDLKFCVFSPNRFVRGLAQDSRFELRLVEYFHTVSD